MKKKEKIVKLLVLMSRGVGHQNETEEEFREPARKWHKLLQDSHEKVEPFEEFFERYKAVVEKMNKKEIDLIKSIKKADLDRLIEFYESGLREILVALDTDLFVKIDNPLRIEILKPYLGKDGENCGST